MNTMLSLFGWLLLGSLLASACQTAQVDPTVVSEVDSVARKNTPTTSLPLTEIVKDYEKNLSGTLYVRRGKQTFIQGFGFSDLLRKVPNTEKTVFLIASNSKNFTAAAVMRLVDMGKVTVDTPVHDILTEFPQEQLQWKDGTVMTVHHLLSHTSGIDDAYNFEPVKGKFFKQPFGIEDVTQALRNRPLKFKPGSRHVYSNTGYILLGEIVRRLAGTSYTSFVQNELFDRARLTETYVGWPGEKNTQVAWSFDIENDERVEILNRSQIKDRHDGDVFTDGNIYTTVTDLDRWLVALMQGRIVSEKSLKAMTTPYLEDYGYGLVVTRELTHDLTKIAHAGSWIGYRSWFSYYPERDVTIVFNCNQTVDKRMVKDMLRRIESAVL